MDSIRRFDTPDEVNLWVTLGNKALNEALNKRLKVGWFEWPAALPAAPLRTCDKCVLKFVLISSYLSS